MANLQRIKELAKERGLTIKALAEHCGISEQAMHKLLRLNSTSIDTLENIANVLQVPVSTFFDGFTTANLTGHIPDTRPRLPMRVAAGMLVGFADSASRHDCEMVPVIHAFPRYDFTMVITGDSMEPKYEGGDEIAIVRVNNIIEWGKPYVLDTRDGAVLKRLYDAGDNVRCVSYNKDYPDFFIPKSDILGVYRIVGQIRY